MESNAGEKLLGFWRRAGSAQPGEGSEETSVHLPLPRGVTGKLDQGMDEQARVNGFTGTEGLQQVFGRNSLP